MQEVQKIEEQPKLTDQLPLKKYYANDIADHYQHEGSLQGPFYKVDEVNALLEALGDMKVISYLIKSISFGGKIEMSKILELAGLKK